MRIASIGPRDPMAMIPKPDSNLSLLPITDAIPTPRAIRKGTVMGPVVTAPKSKALGIKSSTASMDSIMAAMYPGTRIYLMGMSTIFNGNVHDIS